MLRSWPAGVQRGAARIPGAVLILITLAAGGAKAEAPFFYDPLGASALYDPDFYPMNRIGGLLVLMGQAWSDPEGSRGDRPLADQEFVGQYRMQWTLALDPRYSMLVELKGAGRERVLDDDYFLRTEFFYQGLEAPLFLYGGLRIPRRTDFLFYAGIESMSWTPRDIVPPLEVDLPVAFRGFAEVRHDLDDEDPVLRLMALAHTLPVDAVPGLLLSVGVDSFFQEEVAPRWVLEGHAEYMLPLGILRMAAIAGYAADLEERGEQRASLGMRAELF